MKLRCQQDKTVSTRSDGMLTVEICFQRNVTVSRKCPNNFYSRTECKCLTRLNQFTYFWASFCAIHNSMTSIK